MGANPKSGKKGISLPAGVAAGIAAAFAVTLAGVAIVAWLIDGERIAEEAMGYGALAVLLIALGGLAVILMVPFLLLALPGAGMLLCTFPLEKVFQAHLRPEDRIQVVTESEEPTDDQ